MPCRTIHPLCARLATAACCAVLCGAVAARAADRPLDCGPVRGYVCRPAAVPPLIDGRLDDAAWAAADWTEDFVDIRGRGQPAPRHLTRAQMTWDQDCFYVAARLEEPNVWATLAQRDAVIYHENDFELFIDPDGDNHLYYELEINALNTVWDLLLVRPYRDCGPAVDAWDIQGLRSAVAIEGTLNEAADRDVGWTVELAIPWSVLAQCAGRPAPPRDGDIWRLNFSRVQWQTEVRDGAIVKSVDPADGRPLPEDNWVWSPQGLVAMHCPERWGEVLFLTDAAPGRRRQVDAGHRAGEHRSGELGRRLMQVYYAQRDYQEAHGAYAASLADLGLDAGLFQAFAIPACEPGGRLSYHLPAGWNFGLSGDGTRYRAVLDTGETTLTVDETGRLQREPLRPDADGKGRP